jgi:ribose transport system permease protein
MTRARLRDHLAKLQSLVALVVMIAALSLTTDRFLTDANLINILRQIAVNLCLSLGMTMVILSGGIDLSVGSVLALSGAVAAGLLKNGITVAPLDSVLLFTPFGAVVAGVITGAALGAVNGLAITRLRLPPFVATLGMLSIARGLTRLWTGGHPIAGLGDDFAHIGLGRLAGLPMPVVISVTLAIVMAVLSRRTRFGRHLYAVGGNERAAALSGLNVPRIKFAAYTLGGAFAGIAALLVTAELNAAEPNAGKDYELNSIAAVVIGGTSLSGGRGSMMGTVLGCLLIGVLNNGLVLLGVSPDWQLVVKGLVIIAAVAIDRASRTEN